MTDDRGKVLELIKKLLNMAEHAGSNENEALVAATRAEGLMRKYNIDYAEAIATEIKSGVGMVTKDTIATAKDNGTATKKTPLWAQMIAARTGDVFDTPVRLHRVRTPKGEEQVVRFHGYQHDVDVAVWTFDLLIATINKVCKDFRGSVQYKIGGRTVMNAYRIGVVHSVLNKLELLCAEKNTAEESTGTALVLVKRDAIAKKFGEFKYRIAKAPAVKNMLAYRSGREDGRQIEVKTAIQDGSQVKKLQS